MGVENFPGTPAEAKTGQRSAKRNRVLLAAKLGTTAGEVDARLRDLSQKGALVECEQRFAVGDEVVFKRGATNVRARVAWTGAGRVGLEFKREIDESELLVQLGRAPATNNQQRFRRPGLHGSLTEQERKLAKLWSSSVGINFNGD